jgi:hypothetical protein
MEKRNNSNGNKTLTPQDKEHAIFKSVIGINKVLESSYNVDTLNTLTYALLLHEVDLMIERQAEKQQNNG